MWRSRKRKAHDAESTDDSRLASNRPVEPRPTRSSTARVEGDTLPNDRPTPHIR